MSKTYTVAPGREFSYPADAVSLQIVQNVGGRSNLKEGQKQLVKIKNVKEGDDCTDMPKSALFLYVERGWVIEKTDGAVPEKEGI